MNNIISQLLYTLPAILIAISMHEFAHGYVSYRLGDPTPKHMGRLSVNPLAHLDPVGTICLLIFHFGWAKPVGVNPYYYKDRKKGMVMVALAGPIMNFFIAFISIFAMGLILKVTGGYAGEFIIYIFNFLNYLFIINIGLGAFNLIPVPPLDGSKVLGAVLPSDKYFKYMQYERYGTLILMGLLYLGILDVPLTIVRSSLSKVMWTVVSFIFRLG
ncbi:site-2 protease family protein [Alkaliphilus sp. MSJ-5]|uniref:Site-2 protease family protein n=1 Tax=Alkaliphilus flagellatus TaxID=2841507 RepID=A0ABS6FXI2_9FIRM|nr:site-2 protease family protein [Alkaliphilus flagellatus]MBU5674933.1 site-2 protease family protein [Alkaliphilus flagellatus]